MLENWVEGKLAIEIGGVECGTFDPNNRLHSFKQIFKRDPASWFGRFSPKGDVVDPQNVDGWKFWFRIEPK